jgi:hypothetical protein
MQKTLRVLNKMVEDGIISQYAIGGAVAALFYIEPINTNDLDVFFALREMNRRLDVLAPLYKYLAGKGYKGKGEAIDIEGWPVQFLPVFNELLDEAVEQAGLVSFQRTTTRIMSAEHLVAIMLQTGRVKDHARILEFLNHGVVDKASLTKILKRHDLTKKWREFESTRVRQ